MAEIDKDEVREVHKDVKRFGALAGMAVSEGGKVLIDAYLVDIMTTMRTLANGYKRFTHPELIAHCASLENKLDVVKTLSLAPENERLADDRLKELLKRE